MQGILGSVPWTALVFLTLYLQLNGMSDFHAGALMALFLGGGALGSLLGALLQFSIRSWSCDYYSSYLLKLSVLNLLCLQVTVLNNYLERY